MAVGIDTWIWELHKLHDHWIMVNVTMCDIKVDKTI